MHQSRLDDPQSSAPASALDGALLASWPLPLDEGGDKHSRGTVLVIAGSPTTAGAALLSGVAALRMGAGRLQIATAAPIAIDVSIAVPEAMVIPLPIDGSNAVRPRAASVLLAEFVGDARAVLIGPGMFGADALCALTELVVAGMDPDATLIADAAAIDVVGRLPERVRRSIAQRLVLTPNRQELEALLASIDLRGPDASDGRAVAEHFAATVTCFNDVHAFDGRHWSARPATPGLGTSGSGDVLSGLVAGAAARSGDPCQATCWATYVHGEAGNRLSQKQGRTSFLARELLDEVASVLYDLERHSELRANQPS